MKRLFILMIPIALLAAALLATAMEIEPHMTGAERVFTITWEAGSRTNHSGPCRAGSRTCRLTRSVTSACSWTPSTAGAT